MARKHTFVTAVITIGPTNEVMAHGSIYIYIYAGFWTHLVGHESVLNELSGPSCERVGTC